jgi:hypothetical protein
MAFLGSRVERIWLRLGSQARAVSLAARNNGSGSPMTSDFGRSAYFESWVQTAEFRD